MTTRLAVRLGALNLALLLLIAAVSATESFWGMGRDRLPAGALPLSAVAERLEAAGYHAFYEIAVRGGVYHVKTLGPAGDRIALTVDPQTGAILR